MVKEQKQAEEFAKNKEKQDEEELALKRQLVKELSSIKQVGEEANIGKLKLKLLEERKLDTLPADNGILKSSAREERNVIGLKFVITNISNSAQTFNRGMGHLSVLEDTTKIVDVYPFAIGSDKYLKQLGEYFVVTDLVVNSGETKESWIVLEVETAIKNLVFLYPPAEPNSKWAIQN